LRQYKKVSFSHGQQGEFKDFLFKEVEVAFCSDVFSVIEILDHEYNPDQWRLFIHSFVKSEPEDGSTPQRK